ncbi:MAG: hypothetical protein ACLTTO_08840 [Lachnospiraceae bacterium]
MTTVYEQVAEERRAAFTLTDRSSTTKR